MKVSELIDLLKDFDADAEVHIAYPSGDYWRTTLASEVISVSDGIVQYSSYHDDYKLVEYYDEDGEETTTSGQHRVVIGC